MTDSSNQICLAKSPNKVKVGKVLPTLVDGLKKLSKSDLLVSYTAEEARRVKVEASSGYSAECSAILAFLRRQAELERRGVL